MGSTLHVLCRGSPTGGTSGGFAPVNERDALCGAGHAHRDRRTCVRAIGEWRVGNGDAAAGVRQAGSNTYTVAPSALMEETWQAWITLSHAPVWWREPIDSRASLGNLVARGSPSCVISDTHNLHVSNIRVDADTYLGKLFTDPQVHRYTPRQAVLHAPSPLPHLVPHGALTKKHKLSHTTLVPDQHSPHSRDTQRPPFISPNLDHVD